MEGAPAQEICLPLSEQGPHSVPEPPVLGVRSGVPSLPVARTAELPVFAQKVLELPQGERSLEVQVRAQSLHDNAAWSLR